MEHFLNLRRRHQTFVAEYVKCGIASKALVETGYRGPDAKKRAYDILKRPNVQLAVAELVEEAIAEAGVTIAQVVRGAGHRANADRTKLFGKDGKILPADQWPEDVKACVEGLEFDEKGNLVKVRTSRRNDATRLLMQYLKILSERHEHTGAVAVTHSGAVALVRQKADAVAGATTADETAITYEQLMRGASATTH